LSGCDGNWEEYAGQGKSSAFHARYYTGSSGRMTQTAGFSDNREKNFNSSFAMQTAR
jgi:hypothetical protein